MAERYSDPLDAATELTEELNSRAIANFRNAAKPETHPDFDGEHCIDCEDDIPQVRLAMGRVRCVTCQSILERRAQGRGV